MAAPLAAGCWMLLLLLLRVVDMGWLRLVVVVVWVCSALYPFFYSLSCLHINTVFVLQIHFYLKVLYVLQVYCTV